MQTQIENGTATKIGDAFLPTTYTDRHIFLNVAFGD